ncbi:hypothetical protein E2C01_074326 [Portunus trituberculatus]|uniref:Uncharacterized protein n=1 Tax=Portunus trituberculatus TaxID=210409 RepID=A0A5B7I5E3_PORTR|nr:hypothetical protein [Portunus trituberculatus]
MIIRPVGGGVQGIWHTTPPSPNPPNPHQTSLPPHPLASIWHCLAHLALDGGGGDRWAAGAGYVFTSKKDDNNNNNNNNNKQQVQQ